MELRGWNATKWSRLAGVSRGHVRLTIENERESIETKTLIALADTAGVSVEWLATGRGDPLSINLRIADDSKYPSRAKAIAAARLLELDERAIASVLEVSGLSADPGAEYWLSLIRTKQLEHANVAPVGKSTRKGKR